MERMTIKEWCLFFGIKILNTKGFVGAKNKVNNNKYSMIQFRRGLEKSYISVRTQKGLDFMKGGQCNG